MLKTDMIKRLQKEVEAMGDDWILSYKIIDSGGTNSYYMVSRFIPHTKMSKSEFRDFVLDERLKKEKRL